MSASSATGSASWSLDRATLRSMGDEELAVLIRERGRERLAADEGIDLGWLLHAIPDLATRRAPLDAAIDMALRGGSGSSRPDPVAVRTLIERYPELEHAILDAAALSEALWTTSDHAAPRTAMPCRRLPQDFGPAMSSGAQRYELLERVGEGTSGEVFRAIDRQLSDRDEPAIVAIKILHGDRAHERERDRFAEEAAKARRLDHENVVKVYDRDVTPDGEDYIVQEYVGGGNLQDRRERATRPMSPRDAARLIANVARAIQAAHSAGLTHLDLKPANILLTSRGAPKVVDFGLAARHRETTPTDNEPCCIGLPVGTLGFMAPEQFLGEEGAAAPPADIYALGGMLHWLLTDALPNGDRFESIRDAHASGVFDDRELDRARRARRADADLAAICRRALAPDRAERYDTARGLADDLDRWLERRPIRWTNPSPLRSARLFAIRRPAVAALGLACVAAVVVTVVSLDSARRFAATAHEREVEALLHAERLRAEQQWKRKSADDLAELMVSLAGKRGAGMAGEVLTSLWMLEWIHGPVLLTTPDDVPRLWGSRMEVIAELLTERRLEGGEESLEALQLESLLGFWLLKAGEDERALAVLETNIPAWRRRLTPDDPWLDDLDAMRLCAEANRMIRLSRTGSLDEAQLKTCFDIQHSLRPHERRLRERSDGELRLLVLERLHGLFGPEILGAKLDVADWRAWTEQQIAAMNLSAPEG